MSSAFIKIVPNLFHHGFLSRNCNYIFHNPGILGIPGVRAVSQFLRCFYIIGKRGESKCVCWTDGAATTTNGGSSPNGQSSSMKRKQIHIFSFVGIVQQNIASGSTINI